MNSYSVFDLTRSHFVDVFATSFEDAKEQAAVILGAKPFELTAFLNDTPPGEDE